MNNEAIDSRWQCPRCLSKAVLICVPAWFRDPADGALEFQEEDVGADIIGWECKDCCECGTGAPDEVPS